MALFGALIMRNDRNYLRRNYRDKEVIPSLYLGNRQLTPGLVDSITINGFLTIYQQTNTNGILLERRFYPDSVQHYGFETIRIINLRDSSIQLRTAPNISAEARLGSTGDLITFMMTDEPNPKSISIASGGTYDLDILFGGQPDNHQTLRLRAASPHAKSAKDQ